MSRRVQGLAAFCLFLPVLLLGLGSVLDAGRVKQPGVVTTCRVSDIADRLNALPPGTMLTPINDGPELLWRTPHRIIAGNYHHNVRGLVEHFRIWRSVAPDQEARRLVAERRIDYVLGCTLAPDHPGGRTGAPTLARRVAAGEAVDWLPRRERLGDWWLYRRQAVEAGAP